ncbi:MAG TPA: Wzz/FepE/Etk N-terminal domain-containing protein [Syntrophales bacterium]|nr:Wzz/FepE/Etk N-terminal domain-containing protein [Syntrophales bacterium]HOH73305.1 Wzz/FepE/Etk N-terminal domain-containing protein [Syntrophales bacterium]HPN08857.1 Wzz/FepE/Etk N-terminal domain-containing protein [Syntrophales bacterium]HPX81829.1 Wzz/FepE/Etk N-terminal domain-containing protein [Syntrophales bacterium]HQB14942.1 Wzz/FepE/Etk N-terminal domain-containing protein [Syntrophales bacterium]
MGDPPARTPEDAGAGYRRDQQPSQPGPPPCQTENANFKDLTPYDEDEINLLDLGRVIWKRRRLIGYIAAAMVFLTVVVSLLMTNIYQSEAVIMPVAGKEVGAGGGAAALLAAQFGGLAGIATPGSTSTQEIVSLLKSNVLREKVIEQHKLLPVLFEEEWDAEKKRWKAEGGGFRINLNPISWVSSLLALVRPPPPPSIAKKKPGIPDVWDGIRALDEMVTVKHDVKQGSITITGQFPDPELAARVVENFLTTLTDHMSAEARRVALTNQKYLEGQLSATTDPFIKQKIYNLIAQQVETSMMAEVKENFAFKILDPPRVPDQKFKPKRAQMVMLSFVVALFIGIFMAFFLEFLEKQNIHIDAGRWPLINRLAGWKRRLLI